MMTDDQIISELELSHLAHQAQSTNTIRTEYSSLAQRASKLYSFVFKRLGKPIIHEDCFIDGYLESWEVFFLRASKIYSQNRPLGLRFDNSRIYATWHFPEYPSFVRGLVDSSATILLARDVPWIKRIIPSERLIVFRSSAVRKLSHVFQSRLPVVFMFDYCYAETRSLSSNFLGFPCKTPIGLLQLSIRYDYAVSFLTSEGVTLKEIQLDGFDSSSLDKVQSMADNLNELVQAEILKSPPRWLLWPSIDSRWGL